MAGTSSFPPSCITIADRTLPAFSTSSRGIIRSPRCRMAGTSSGRRSRKSFMGLRCDRGFRKTPGCTRRVVALSSPTVPPSCMTTAESAPARGSSVKAETTPMPPNSESNSQPPSLFNPASAQRAAMLLSMSPKATPTFFVPSITPAKAEVKSPTKSSRNCRIRWAFSSIVVIRSVCRPCRTSVSCADAASACAVSCTSWP